MESSAHRTSALCINSHNGPFVDSPARARVFGFTFQGIILDFDALYGHADTSRPLLAIFLGPYPGQSTRRVSLERLGVWIRFMHVKAN